MKTIFNEADKNEILQRIEKLTPESKALWGKMNVTQMLAHCAKGTEMAIGEIRPKSSPMQFLGRLLKKKIIYSNDHFRKNSPTAQELIVVNPQEFSKEKVNFIAAIKRLTSDITKAEKHPFFGKMTTEEWGIINYKHADHHLRQFGV
jgi:hypothetical protein